MKDFKEYETKTLDDPEFLRIRELYTGKYVNYRYAKDVAASCFIGKACE